MSVNKVAKRLIDHFYGLDGGKSFSEMNMEEYRAATTYFYKFCGPEHAEKVALIKDDKIPGPYGDIPIRIYYPNLKPHNSAMIYLRGGGFVLDNLEDEDHVCRELANETGRIIIAIGFRAAPEYKYPIGLDDSFAVTKWLFNNGELLNINTNDIAIAGGSAGANFAALVALRARDAGLNLSKQLLLMPCLDLTSSMPSHKKYGDGYLLDQEMIDLCFEKYLPNGVDPKDPNVSPLFAKDLTGLPPTLVLTAECDPLVDSGRAYYERLKQAKVDAKYHCCLGQIHALLVYRHALPKQDDPLQVIAEFLN
ncbi:MAG: alpha/beta hydrolase [Gammaproteobacteria bacterium]|nr:alpha/beta hydrolase [Gammaproteobacteria bacterium]